MEHKIGISSSTEKGSLTNQHFSALEVGDKIQPMGEDWRSTRHALVKEVFNGQAIAVQLPTWGEVVVTIAQCASWRAFYD